MHSENKICTVCYNGWIWKNDENIEKINNIKIRKTAQELVYKNRFECLQCKNVVCRECVCEMTGIVIAKIIRPDPRAVGNWTHRLDHVCLTEELKKKLGIKENFTARDEYNGDWTIPGLSIAVGGVVYYGFYKGVAGVHGPIKCPICRRKCYRQYFGPYRDIRGAMNEDILREIKAMRKDN